MTDRIFALSIALEHDMRDDDVQAIIDAIKLIQGVLAVEMHVADSSQWTALERARSELSRELWKVLKEGYQDET